MGEGESGELVLSLDDVERRTIADLATRQSVETIDRRLRYFGVPRPGVALDEQSPHRLRVEMPASESLDLEAVERLLGNPGVLELRLVDRQAGTRTELLETLGGIEPPEESDIVCEQQETAPPKCYSLAPEVVIDGRDLTGARPGLGTFNQPVVNFSLTRAAGERFRKFTAGNIGRQLAILVDGRLLSAPVIQGEIGDQGMIDGDFTTQEVADLATVLRSGALPGPVHVIASEPMSGARWLRAFRVGAAICAALLGLSGVWIGKLALGRLRA